MRVAVTGAAGFLGRHLRLAIAAHRPQWQVLCIDRDGLASHTLAESLTGCDAVIHLAGINRAPDEEVERGNERLATVLDGALATAGSTATVVFANSVQAEFDNPYGRGKAAAARVLGKGCTERGARFEDVLLPNLYGEGGRPQYNSFVATFVAKVLAGEEPQVTGDRQMTLLHAQDASEFLLACVDADRPPELPAGETAGISEVAGILTEQWRAYVERAEFPDLSTRLRLRLFNCLRFAAFPGHYPVPLTRHTDARGSFVEIARVGGGPGQTSFSTTVPGIRRGDHFHLRKAERFVVVRGSGLIRLRHVLDDECVEFRCNGDAPVVVDMPTGWTHSIENIGDDELITLFWINEPFDPTDPDTFPCVVSDEPVRRAQEARQ